jgi:hypothetical protein
LALGIAVPLVTTLMSEAQAKAGGGTPTGTLFLCGPVAIGLAFVVVGVFMRLKG